PIQAFHKARHLIGRHARGIGAANQRAHAGAGDIVDRHMQLFQHFDDADVTDAFCPATAEHEADFGTIWGGLDVAALFRREYVGTGNNQAEEGGDAGHGPDVAASVPIWERWLTGTQACKAAWGIP